MKIYFEDPEYDAQFLRALDYAPLGAQIGEAWVIAGEIRAPDAASWYHAWSSYADRLYDIATKSHAAGRQVSARNTFLRASNYYRRASEGAGEHCEVGAREVFFQKMFDWLDPIVTK